MLSESIPGRLRPASAKIARSEPLTHRRHARAIASHAAALSIIAAAVVFAQTEAAMILTSTSFPEGGEIPEVHTCKGADASPPLAWTNAPAGTKSFALIVDDPDAPDPAAPKRTWVHWVLYDIEPTSSSLSQDYGRNDPGLPVRAGMNDWSRTGYGGPCPPVGRHRYFFKLYALDTVLGDLGKPDKATLEKAMEGHVLAKTQLIGTFQK
jgi:Raf kinase inhibitor-like YbhB/YbcL family protein